MQYKPSYAVPLLLISIGKVFEEELYFLHIYHNNVPLRVAPGHGAKREREGITLLGRQSESWPICAVGHSSWHLSDRRPLFTALHWEGTRTHPR